MHTTPEEFENREFTNRIKCFPSTLSQRKLTMQHSWLILDLCLKKSRSGTGSHDYRDVIVFSPRENEKPAFSNSSGLNSVYEKLRFCNRSLWTQDLTWEITLRFFIFSVIVWTGHGARFSKLPVITGPVKLFYFPLRIRFSKVLKFVQ